MKILLQEMKTNRTSWFNLPIKSMKEITGRFAGFHEFFDDLEIVALELDLQMTLKINRLTSINRINHIASQLKTMSKRDKLIIISYLIAYDTKDALQIEKAIRTLRARHYKIYPLCYNLEDLGKSIAYDLGMFEDSEESVSFDFEQFGRMKFRQGRMVQIEDMFVSFY